MNDNDNRVDSRWKELIGLSDQNREFDEMDQQFYERLATQSARAFQESITRPKRGWVIAGQLALVATVASIAFVWLTSMRPTDASVDEVPQLASAGVPQMTNEANHWKLRSALGRSERELDQLLDERLLARRSNGMNRWSANSLFLEPETERKR